MIGDGIRKEETHYIVEWLDIFSGKYEYMRFRTLAEARSYASTLDRIHEKVKIWKQETIKLQEVK